MARLRLIPDADQAGTVEHKLPVLLAIADIETKGLIRRPRASRIAAIAANIGELGQTTPIEVSPTRVTDGRQIFALTKGWVRLEAMRGLGVAHILARVQRATSGDRRRREIDDNLLGDGCTSLDRARYLAVAKDDYERLHPETCHGVAGKTELPNLATPRFSTFAASRYGLQERSVQRACTIGERLDHTVAELLADTAWADHQSALETLSRQEPETQRAVAELLTRAEDPIDNVQAAIAMVVGAPEADVAKKAWSAFLGGYGRLGARERREALREIANDLPTGVRIIFDGDAE